MSVPAEPRQQKSGAGSQSRNRPQRRQHQPYKRTSAIIDDRPDGKPILFGYGRHMSKREKEDAKRLIAYSALAVVVAISLSVIVVAAAYSQWIYPNNSVAWVNRSGISRHDRDVMTSYFTARLAAQGTSTGQDPQALAVSQLQRSRLTILEAKSQLGMVATDAEITAKLKTLVPNAATQSNFNSMLSTTGLSSDDYKRLFLTTQVLEDKIGSYLIRNKPKTADEWHYARIQVANKKTATQLLTQIALNSGNKGGTQQTLFTKLAKSKSTDTTTAPQGGDMGWERPTDAGTDPVLSSGLLTVLKDMGKTHTTFKLYNTGTSWYVIEFIGHDAKHALTATQVTADKTAAFNAWYAPLEAKATFDPALVSNSANNGATTSAASQSQAVNIVPTAVTAK